MDEPLVPQGPQAECGTYQNQDVFLYQEWQGRVGVSPPNLYRGIRKKISK